MMFKEMNKEFRPELDNVIFDADDTLWYLTPIYNNKIRQFSDRVRDFIGSNLLDNITIEKMFCDEQIRLINERGFDEYIFPLAGKNVFIDLCKKMDIENKSINIYAEMLYDLLFHVHNIDPYFYDDLPHHLNTLSEYYNIFVYTKGYDHPQYRKVVNSGVYNELTGLYIGSTKHYDEWEYVVNDINEMKKSKNVSYKTSLTIVGDSIKSDILMGLQFADNVVYIKNDNVWKFECCDCDFDNNKISIYENGFLDINHEYKNLGIYHCIEDLIKLAKTKNYLKNVG